MVGVRTAPVGAAQAAVAAATTESVSCLTIEEGRDPAGAGALEAGDSGRRYDSAEEAVAAFAGEAGAVTGGLVAGSPAPAGPHVGQE